jgi:hypothetical protein
MAKKNSVSKKGVNFFHQSRSNDPIGNILAAAANMVVNHGLQRLSQNVSKRMGLTGVTPEDTIKLQHAQLSLRKLEVGITREQLVNRKRSKLLDLEVQEKEMHLEKVKQQLENKETQRVEQAIHVSTEPISGALEVIADAEGLFTAVGQMEAYAQWIESLSAGKVILVLGKRGSGKSAFVAKMAEFLMAVNGMITYWIGAPETARSFVPHWIKLVNTLDNCPANSFVMCDEAGIDFLSLMFNTSTNRLMRRMLMIARHKHISLAFATQSSRDIDYAIVRQADSIIFKEPGLHQPDSERAGIKPKAQKAAVAFKQMPREEKIGSAYVFDDSFEGIINSNVPSFWTEDLSHIYSQLDISRIENGARNNERLQTPIDSASNLLSNASLEQEILELHQLGNGIEKISKLLGCTTWTVRKCLDKNR